MEIVSILAPVLILVALGFLLRKIDFLDSLFFRNSAKLTYWVGLPSLLFYKIANAEVDYSDSWKISLVMIMAIAAVLLLALAVSMVVVQGSGRRRTFILTSVYSNTAYVGLPVMFYALSSTGNSHLIDVASMAVAPMIPFINIISTVIMGGSSGGSGKMAVAGIIRKVVLNPLIIACLAGIAAASAGLELPLFINRGLDSLGQMALPLALLSIGAGLSFSTMKGSLLPAVTASIFNIFLLPFMGFIFSRYLGLSDSHTLIALVFMACPTAASTFIYAREMGGDYRFAGNVIVLSTLMATVSLWIVLALYI